MLDNILKRAFNELDNGDVDAAISLFLEGYNEYNGMFNLDCLLGLAQCYTILGKYKEAKNMYLTMLDMDEMYATAYYGLATIYEEENKIDRAIAYYQETIKLDPNYASAYFFLAGIYDDLKETSLAKENYQKCIKVDPNYFWAYINLGSIFEENNEDEAAYSCFIKALDIMECNIVYFNLGVVARKLNIILKSIMYYEKAIAFEHYDYKSYLNLALIYKDFYQNYLKAIEIYTEGIKYNEDVAVLYYNRGCCYVLVNKLDLALKDIKQSMVLSPNISKYAATDEELKPIIEKI